LDLFVNADERYPFWVEQILEKLFEAEQNKNFVIDRTTVRRLQNFSQIFISSLEYDQCSLKIDFVNDVAKHYGDFEVDEQLGQIDSWRNILSNKISAVFRFEAKDIADLWIISRHVQFNWREIIEEAKTKEAGVEPEVIYNILRSFPQEQLRMVKWAQNPDYRDVKKDLDIIADDLFYGRQNSVCKVTE